jgi:RimJ/RimL family protein N-acetyltransferase
VKIDLPIRTRRLLLREFREGDWKDVQRYAQDPKVVEFLPWGPNTPEQTREFIAKAIEEQRTVPRNSFSLAIALRGSGRVIGGIRLGLRSVKHRRGDIGYVLARDCWGKGLATEATRAVVEFGFTSLNLHRIYATCDARNKASARVLEKAGMKREGRLRESAFLRGRWRDSLVYAILENARRPRPPATPLPGRMLSQPAQ